MKSHSNFPITILQTDNGSEFINSTTVEWMRQHQITPQYCQKDDKKCLGVVERFNRTVKYIFNTMKLGFFIAERTRAGQAEDISVLGLIGTVQS